MDEETAAQFVHSVVKSLQALCHGYVEFGQSVEIIGHLYLNVDKRKKYNYIVQEQVCKSDTEGSTIFISNSYHAATPGKKVVPKQQEVSQTAELKSPGSKKSVDYIPYSEQSLSQEVPHTVSDGNELSSAAVTSHNVQPMYSSTPQRENVFQRKRNHSGGTNRDQVNFSSSRSGSVGENTKSFSAESVSHSGPSFSPKAAQRISSNIERALNSGNFSRHENTSSGNISRSENMLSCYSAGIDGEKRHPVTSVPEGFSNNVSHNPGMLPTDLRSSDIRPNQRMSLGSVSKTVTNESRKRFLKDHSVGAMRAAYTNENDFNLDLSCVKKEADVSGATASCSVQDCEDRIVYHDQRSWNKTSIGDPQDSSSYSGEDECKMDSGTDEDNALSQDLTQQAVPYPLGLHPNTGTSGYGGPVFPQNFPDSSLDQTSAMSDSEAAGTSSSSLNMSGRIPSSGGFSRGPYNNPSAPRPGKVPAEVASKYNRNSPRQRFHIKPNSWTGGSITVVTESATCLDHPLNLSLDSPSPSKDLHGIHRTDSTVEASGCVDANNSTHTAGKSPEGTELEPSPTRKSKVLKMDGNKEHDDNENHDEAVALRVDGNDKSFSSGSVTCESVDSIVVKTETLSPSEEQFSDSGSQHQSSLIYYSFDAKRFEESVDSMKHIINQEMQKLPTASKYGKLPTAMVTKFGYEPVVHYLELIPATLKQNRGARKRCRVCYATGRRRDTRFQCAVCYRKPGLCPIPCMQKYHDQMSCTNEELSDAVM